MKFTCHECGYTFHSNKQMDRTVGLKPGEYCEYLELIFSVCPRCHKGNIDKAATILMRDENDSCSNTNMDMNMQDDETTHTEPNGSAVVNILGTKYSITMYSDDLFSRCTNTEIGECGGICNSFLKEIYIAERDTEQERKSTRAEMVKLSLRHEIVHAFLFESGMDENSNPSEAWGTNEEMVEWFSTQGPKIYQAWREANAI